MIEKLRKLNPELNIYSVHDKEFKKYGKVLKIDNDELVSVAQNITLPESGSAYKLNVEELNNLNCSKMYKEILFGGCEIQTGICMGYNTKMDALEFHKSSEINIAITPLILLLGLEYEMEDNEFNSENIKAFYVNKGETVELFGTTLHFCPCQVDDNGFSNVVILPEHTNAILEKKFADKLLFKKNKWLICHKNNTELINKGIYPGIYGENYEIKYQ